MGQKNFINKIAPNIFGPNALSVVCIGRLIHFEIFASGRFETSAPIQPIWNAWYLKFFFVKQCLDSKLYHQNFKFSFRRVDIEKFSKHVWYTSIFFVLVSTVDIWYRYKKLPSTSVRMRNFPHWNVNELIWKPVFIVQWLEWKELVKVLCQVKYN